MKPASSPPSSESGRAVRWINRISVALLLFAIPAAVYIAVTGKGLTDGSFGPAAYYYTDVANWQEIFYGADETGVSGLEVGVALAISIALTVIFSAILNRSSRQRKSRRRNQTAPKTLPQNTGQNEADA